MRIKLKINFNNFWGNKIKKRGRGVIFRENIIYPCFFKTIFSFLTNLFLAISASRGSNQPSVHSQCASRKVITDPWSQLSFNSCFEFPDPLDPQHFIFLDPDSGYKSNNIKQKGKEVLISEHSLLELL